MSFEGSIMATHALYLVSNQHLMPDYNQDRAWVWESVPGLPLEETAVYYMNTKLDRFSLG